MENVATKTSELQFDLGTFEGFNFKEQSAIDHILTADEVMAWDHDKDREAEFWPAGDSAGVALVFQGKTSVTASELRDLDRLLGELGGDSDENFLRIHCAQESHGKELDSLSGSDVEDQNSHFLSARVLLICARKQPLNFSSFIILKPMGFGRNALATV